MKKTMVMAGILFALTMTAGCGNQNQDNTATTETQTQDVASEENANVQSEAEDNAESENADQKQTDESGVETDVTETEEGSSKVLVAYYSATGNTKVAAETIADAVGGELFELQPAESYTTGDLDYNDPESRVCKEHEDSDLQDVKLAEVTPEAFSDAEVVFLGYPKMEYSL